MKTMWKNSKLYQRLHHFFSEEIPYEKDIFIGGEPLFLREIKTSDIPELLKLEKKVYEGELPWSRSAFLIELRSVSLHRYLLIETHEEILGFIGLRIHGRDCHITNIAVSPSRQGKGYGTFLLEEGKTFAKEKECSQMSLEVRRSNLKAQSLYRRFGFVSKNIKKNYYTENEEDAVEMIYEF